MNYIYPHENEEQDIKNLPENYRSNYLAKKSTKIGSKSIKPTKKINQHIKIFYSYKTTITLDVEASF